MAVAKLLQTTVTPQFAPSAEGLGNVPLVIEGDPGAYGDDFIHLLLIPAVNATIVASVGNVQTRNVKPVNVPAGAITFSGSNVATLPRVPVYSNPTFQVLFAFNLSGQGTSIGISYDAQANQVKANKACYAAVAYTEYQTSGRELLYSPEIVHFGKGSEQRFGVIAAFAPPRSLVTHQVQAPTFDNGNAEFEVYRKVSYAVATPDGEFEMPPSYPSSGSYPDRPTVLDVSTSLRTERVHEIGLMDANGRAWVRTFFVPVQEPYVGDAVYAQNLVNNLQCKVSTLPAGQFSNQLILKAKGFIKSQGLGC